MYNCGTGICINASRLCDGINDCGDGDPGSDETEAVCSKYISNHFGHILYNNISHHMYAK